MFYLLVAAEYTRIITKRLEVFFLFTTNAFWNSFFPRMVSGWNTLHAAIVDCPTVSLFLCALANKP